MSSGKPKGSEVGTLLARLRHGQGHGARIARAATGTFGMRVAGMALAFVMVAVVARVLGTEHWGYYAYALAWLQLLFLLAKFGFDNVLLRFVAAYRRQEEWGLLRGLLHRSNQAATVISVVVGLGMVGATALLADRMDRDLVWTFWCAGLVTPFLALAQLRQAALRGLLVVVLAQLPEILLRPLFTMCIVLVISVVMTEPVTAPLAMLGYGASVLITFVIGAVLLRYHAPRELRTAAPVYRDREWIGVAFPLMLFSGIHLALGHLDTMMLGVLADTTQAGIYSAASRVAALTLFGLTAVNAIAAPMFASLHAAGDTAELQRVLRLSSLGIVGITLPLAAVLLLAGESILGAFGDDFRAGYDAFAILVGAHAVNAIAGPVGSLMTMTGHHTTAMYVLGLAVVVDAVLNVVFIPIWGVTGAALATGISVVLWNLCLVALANRRLGVRTSITWLLGK